MAHVSVIVPTYNRLRFLKPAIESVLAQTYADWDMTIADDGSDEKTRAYLSSLRGPRTRLLQLSHTGNPSYVRNVAIGSATGRYVAFLDSDDVWAPTKLECQMEALETSPASGWCYCLEQMIDATGAPWTQNRARTYPPMDGWVFGALLRLELALSMPTILARRDLIDRIGGFDESLRFCEWHDLCLRLALQSEVIAARQILCSVRSHDEHYSADRTGELRGWVQLYAKMARIAPSAELRSYCRRQAALACLRVASFRGHGKGRLARLTAMLQAVPDAWRVMRLR